MVGLCIRVQPHIPDHRKLLTLFFCNWTTLPFCIFPYPYPLSCHHVIHSLLFFSLLPKMFFFSHPVSVAPLLLLLFLWSDSPQQFKQGYHGPLAIIMYFFCSLLGLCVCFPICLHVRFHTNLFSTSDSHGDRLTNKAFCMRYQIHMHRLPPPGQPSHTD